MSRGWQIFLITAATVLVPGGLYAGVGIYALTNICFNFKRFELTGIDKTFIGINFVLQIKNPSRINVHIDGYDIDVAINGTKVANIISANKKTLAGEKTNILVLPIKINYKETFGVLKSAELISLFAKKEYSKIYISLEGRFNGSLLKIPIRRKINMKYTLAEIVKMASEPSEPC